MNDLDINEKDDNCTFVTRRKAVMEITKMLLLSIITIVAILPTALLSSRLTRVNNKVKDVSEAISSTQKDVDSLSERVTSMEDCLGKDGGVQEQLDELSKKLDAMVSNASTGNTQVSKNTNTPVVTPSAIVGADASGREYRAFELVNRPVILTYVENNNEVYALGQWNENYHWNGLCVVNVYSPDEQLCEIREVTFKDGVRTKYRSVTKSDLTDGQWKYHLQDDITGNSKDKVCYVSYSKAKVFAMSNARITDLLYVDEFITKYRDIQKEEQ